MQAKMSTKQPVIIHSVVCTFQPVPFGPESEEKTFVHCTNEEVKDLILALYPDMSGPVGSIIVEYACKLPAAFLRMSHIRTAIHSNGAQSKSARRVHRMGVNAFLDFSKIYSEGIGEFGIINKITINCCQFKKKNQEFARSLEIRFKTTIKSEFDGKSSFTRVARLSNIERWKMVKNQNYPFG